VSLSALRCTDFRCLANADIELDPDRNLIVGPNASGKTSVLESIGYLGRGKSFRGATTAELIRHGQSEFAVVGKVQTAHRTISLGVGNSRAGALEVHTDGERRRSVAALAELLPLLVIDPDVHRLVAGGPDDRRRYLDWIAFHVEHDYLDLWRRYRQALKQRNAALKSGQSSAAALLPWTQEMVASGERIDAARRRVVATTEPLLAELSKGLLRHETELAYGQGWPAEFSIAEALDAGIERDRQRGSTQCGPHRADLKLGFDEHRAKKTVSRGQQKLLSCALILAASQIVTLERQQAPLLLLDDPAAELDSESLARLLEAISETDGQIIATSLKPDHDLFQRPTRVFHVEQGNISPQK